MFLRPFIILSALFLASLHSLTAREEHALDKAWSFVHSPKFSEEFPDGPTRSVDIPHDWSWEAGPRKNGAQKDKGGYRIGGVGWYRKEFTLPDTFAGKRISVHFDGAYRYATVFINGHKLGTRPYGFISFKHDLTEHLTPGKNTLEVRLDCRLEPSTRWYHPCGLYAPVTLVTTDASSYILDDHTFITTPEVSAAQSTVNVATRITNPDGLTLDVAVLSPDGKELGKLTTSASDPTARIRLSKLKRWSPDTPHLHTAVLTLREGEITRDEIRVPFGVRSIRWDKDTGFHINGKVVKLKGVCEHLTGGPVGGAWPEPLIEWKLRLLKSMGCNAIRTAHNPQIPAFYDLCDELGIMVMDEIFDGWSRKADQDYGALDFDQWWRKDLSAWIRRDRNHPSIVIWSVGNETHGKVANEIVKLCHELDPTRPVTSGASGSHAMDVLGVNGNSESQKFFKRGPSDKAFVATEAPHTWQVRGYYKSRTWYRDGFPNKRQDPFETPDLTPTEIFTQAFLAPDQMTNRKQFFNSSYDNATVRINARQHWEKVRDLPWISGNFRWTGFDYPGEAGYVHGGWPFHAFAGGALDLAGFEKDLYHFYQSQWTTEPMVQLLPHWTHPMMTPGTRIPVQAYSNADEVELLFNGKSLGTDRPGRRWDEMQCQWLVPWQPGTLTAIARRAGKEVARDEFTTAAAPQKLAIGVDRALADHPIITLTTTDADGNPNPYGENPVHAVIEGHARVLSFENGHPADTSTPIATHRRAFMGKTRLFLEGSPTSLTFGSILGERRQLTSDLVSIFVEKVDAAGTTIPTDFSIHYTLDGSAPTSSSSRFSQPFPVPASCTVKALVLHDNQPVMTLSETFGPTLGLHWASEDETQDSGSTTALQAESAKFKTATISRKGQGYHGGGYLDFGGKEGSVEFYQENDGPPGKATLIIRYTNADSKSQRPLQVTLNGEVLTTAKFPQTASWGSDWKTIKIPTTLRAGANTLILETTGKSAPNLDEVEFR